MSRKFGLAFKLLAATILVVAAVALTMSTRAASQLADRLTANFDSKGEAIALALAAAAEQSAGTDVSTVQGSVDANKVITGVAYIYIADSHGTPYVHTFSPTFPSGLQGRNAIGVGEDLGGKRVKILRDVVFEGPKGTMRATDVAAPVGGGALGTVHVGMNQQVVDEAVAELRASTLGWGAATALAGIALSFVLTLLVVIRPIRELTRVTGDIVQKGDLTQTIAIRSNDEIGELASTFAQMVTRLREIPLEIGESTRLLAQSVEELGKSTAEQSQTVSRQASALQETQATAQEINQTSLMAAQKAEGVLKYADRAETISRTGEQAVEQSVAALTEIRARVEEIAQRIATLGERTAQIGHVTQSVKHLADQSNMLALNAAIEAVRSGEHGKGFAVVAREIRSLADQSIEATNRVRDILEDIAAATQAAVTITEKGAQRIDAGLAQVRTSGEKLAELSGIVKENAAAVRQINAAVGQQNAGVAQIFGAVTDQNTMMSDTMTRLEATQKAVHTLNDVSQRLVQVVERFRI